MDYRLIFRSLVHIVWLGEWRWWIVCVWRWMPHPSTKTVWAGKSTQTFIRGVTVQGGFGQTVTYDFNIPEKLRKEICIKSYRWPTQVDWSSRPREARETSLRNSANQLGVLSKDALPIARWGAVNEVGLTVYQKHRSVPTRKRIYTGWGLPSAGRLSARVISPQGGIAFNRSPSERQQ